MGPEIIIPLILLAIIVPTVLTWAKRNLRDPAKEGASAASEPAPGGRLTSAALRDLPSPPWRVVYEIADDKLGGVEHVLIGPSGVFAVRTSMDPMPAGPPADPSPTEIAQPAIVRSELDDALRRCAMESDLLVRVHWGTGPEGPAAIDTLPGSIAVDGRRIEEWADALDDRLTSAQVDLAWQTVTTAIGRPDPLG